MSAEGFRVSGVQEGQEWPLNLLITLSPNFLSSHSVTLTAACAVRGTLLRQRTPPCCSQKRLFVTVARTSGPPQPSAVTVRCNQSHQLVVTARTTGQTMVCGSK